MLHTFYLNEVHHQIGYFCHILDFQFLFIVTFYGGLCRYFVIL